jgi:UPF0755 protein
VKTHRYKIGKKRRRGVPRRVWGLLIAIVLIAIAGAIVSTNVYDHDLRPVNNDQSTHLFTVNEGSSVKQIASQLQQGHLIRSGWAFELYVHAHDLANALQAGTYDFSSSQSTAAVINILTHGKVATKLVTILPGKRIDQVKADLINDGFSPSSVSSALSPSLYSDVPALAFKPAGIDSLAGLLWPDSFQKQPNTNPAVIIRESLEEMSQHLTPSLQTAFASEGLSTYQGLVLASIVNQEVSKQTDQAQVAQVFISRLKANMPLGSDVTALYGSIEAGQSPNLSYDSPYNTLIHTGLPPTPISTVSASSLNAAAHPADTNWLYFVAGDNGTTYFSVTLAQHQAQTTQYCHKLCGN